MIISLLLLAILIYVLYDFYVNYKGAVGSAWDRALAAGRGSATILWARFTAAVAACAGAAAGLAEFLGSPGVASAIQTYMQPSYVAVLMISIAVISEWARRRTL